jgi:hypothetical protein
VKGVKDRGWNVDGVYLSRGCAWYTNLDAKMSVAIPDIRRSFLSCTTFAVVGASKDQSKYGTKVRASRSLTFLLPHRMIHRF